MVALQQEQRVVLKGHHGRLVTVTTFLTFVMLMRYLVVGVPTFPFVPTVRAGIAESMVEALAHCQVKCCVFLAGRSESPRKLNVTVNPGLVVF